MALGMAKILLLKTPQSYLSSVATFMESRPTRQVANPARLAPTITTSVSRVFAVSSLHIIYGLTFSTSHTFFLLSLSNYS